MHIWDLEAGRCITRDGVPYISIRKNDKTDPCEADTMARDITEWLQGREMSRHLQAVASTKKGRK